MTCNATILQQELRRIKSQQIGGNESSSTNDDICEQTCYPLRPVGVLQSCFTNRNGTPRQPLLVQSARAVVTLRRELSEEFFDGLKNYSHCWLLYIFHKNTDIQKLWDGSFQGVKGKIRVPRLDGARVGAFATRSPHRPCPIGLSVAKILEVSGRRLVVGGADVVDGSPVLDIKPYVPFCDSVPDAQTPVWVDKKSINDPLFTATVDISPRVESELEACWKQRGSRSMFTCFKEYAGFVREALSRDIRSVTQRVKVPNRKGKGFELERMYKKDGNSAIWHVVLDGIDIGYNVLEKEERVILESCSILE